jgi:hypothetical protein
VFYAGFPCSCHADAHAHAYACVPPPTHTHTHARTHTGFGVDTELYKFSTDSASNYWIKVKWLHIHGTVEPWSIVFQGDEENKRWMGEND